MGNVRKLLVVTGTRREAALIAGSGVTVLAGGGNGDRLSDDLARLAPNTCGIISFGTCGGLVPGQCLGDMVIGSHVVGAETGACNPAWVKALSHALPSAQIGPVFADGSLLTAARQKRQAARSGAIVADMESHLAGAAATRHGLPFAILRCISDTVEATLPSAVAVAMQPGGGLALGAILASILRQPSQFPALIHAGIGFGRAFAALQAGALAVGPRLGFDRR